MNTMNDSKEMHGICTLAAYSGRPMLSFPLLLKAYRKEHHCTQSQLARALCNVSTRTLQKWETGEHCPPEWVVKMVIDRLNTMQPPERIITPYQHKKLAAIVANKIASSKEHQDALITMVEIQA
jgi:DNA-binding transcriptional regulator YiaG